MPLRPTRTPLFTLTVALLATLLGPVAAASADVIGARPAPAVWDVTPATGEIVRAGVVSVSATGLARDGIRSAQFRVDGVDITTTITSRTAVAARASGRVSLAAGDHVVQAIFVDGAGREFFRHWRFTATDRPWQRLAGADRIETAAVIARQGGGGRPAAVVALASEFPDALAGVPLALAVDGPLLLTETDRLSPATRSALQDLVVDAGRVHVLGGTGSISIDTVGQIKALGFRVTRYAGADRYETAALIADALPPSDTVVVASGESFPDALAVAGPAAAKGWPVLLSRPDALPASTRQRLVGRDRAFLVGGARALSADVMGEVRTEVSVATRLAGADRFATAVAVVDALGPSSSDRVAVASGLDFPDALGGAVHAASNGYPLLLSGPHALPLPVREHATTVRPQGVVAYGGTRALDDAVAAMLLAAGLDDGPSLVAMDPSPQAVVVSIDQIRLEFSDDVDLSNSNLSVHFDGIEMHSSMSHGDFKNAVVVNLGPLPSTPRYGVDTPVRVVGTLHSSSGWRHLDDTVTFRKLAMSRGDAGPDVEEVQQQLLDAGYWLDVADGNFGSLTVQAVMAFQKVHGLTVTGAVDPQTKELIATAGRPAPASSSGTLVEVDKSRQVLFFVRDGATEWVFNTSTGTEKPYTHEGRTYLADTPPGRWSFFREVDGERESELGILWRPKYFHGDGIAIHGSASVPAYAASHGCVRVTYQAMDFIWAEGLAPMGRAVWVYGTTPGT